MGLSPGERRAVLFAPLPLRVVLGATFLWAGLGKVLSYQPVSGQDAATLANMGLVAPQARPAPGPADAPAKPLPEPTSDAGSDKGESTGKSGEPATASLVLMATPVAPAQSAPTPAGTPSTPQAYQASDFAQPVSVRRLWGIALSVYQAAHPAAPSPRVGGAAGRAPFAIWPALLSEGLFPKAQAVGVTGLEIVGGSFLLIGFFTRLVSVCFVLLMLAALWLTQIGPALQAGGTSWGFLPGYPAFDEQAWSMFFWQLALLGGSAALALTGPGILSADRALTPRLIPARPRSLAARSGPAPVAEKAP